MLRRMKMHNELVLILHCFLQIRPVRSRNANEQSSCCFSLNLFTYEKIFETTCVYCFRCGLPVLYFVYSSHCYCCLISFALVSLWLRCRFRRGSRKEIVPRMTPRQEVFCPAELHLKYTGSHNISLYHTAKK